MSLTKSDLSFDVVDTAVFPKVLSLYSNVLKAFYRTKVKGDDSKREQALEDDLWRYKQFPTELKQRGPGAGITKDELERLVKWKITHQTNRPFLLPQIRKNDPKAVEKCTAEAHRILSAAGPSKDMESPHGPSRDTVRKALDKVCELTGVGPATGTLILSVYDGDNIPFFEDELHAWLFPNHSVKLKYNIKEYFEILDRFNESRQKIGPASDPFKLAEAYEKFAFACEHWNLVPEQERPKAIDSKTSKQEDTASRDAQQDAGVPRDASLRTGRSHKPATAKRKDTKDEQDASSQRRSKRIKSANC